VLGLEVWFPSTESILESLQSVLFFKSRVQIFQNIRGENPLVYMNTFIESVSSGQKLLQAKALGPGIIEKGLQHVTANQLPQHSR
jgi:hypothetical protein